MTKLIVFVLLSPLVFALVAIVLAALVLLSPAFVALQWLKYSYKFKHYSYVKNQSSVKPRRLPVLRLGHSSRRFFSGSGRTRRPYRNNIKHQKTTL